VAPARVFIGSPTWLSSCQGSNLAANPPKPFQDWFLANESHVSFFVVNNGRKTLLECTFNHPVNRVHLSFANTSSGKLTIEISTAKRKDRRNTLNIPLGS
jgi:hypothetical protein